MSEPSVREGVLVVQPLPGIGDMVWHVPHLLAIARHEPEGRVSVLTKARSLSDQLLAGLSEVSEVLWVERKPGRHDGVRGLLRLASELRGRRYRKVWILHDSSRYTIAAWLAGIPHRAGIASGWQRLLLTDRPARPVPAGVHSVERANRLLQGLGLQISRPVPLVVPPEQSRAEVRLRFSGLARPWLILGIGSSEAYKQWGAENFSMLAGALLNGYGGSCFLLGGRSEEHMAASIRHSAISQGAVVPLIQQPLQEIIALLAEARLFVGNDTGMLNLAAACGVPSIGLFGHPISAWVASSSPCIHPVYPPAGLSTEGVRQIRPQLVLQAIERLGVLE
ncbi:glycosyltransferase family 9 protein [Accumulibacter sp.]|uniref:glycosyltransferase family 9 protein n=1 Tax=Accumulibacter sp. TaxID=2053492 RepID=UPI0025E6F21B|nr:glycosyltransferase family 9 protein [Accumulibacter sp.]MCM8593927.1 glycosyltransferase family 9 protein [Accumulibacter sp.]MCM8627776.1 glycosyltransferase family 9 protein [Accumulibacter sp.]MDS4048068.1 glycosyltransferase family 9 protein [Accumulibacter sp.]